jgi:hypothetical protein
MVTDSFFDLLVGHIGELVFIYECPQPIAVMHLGINSTAIEVDTLEATTIHLNYSADGLDPHLVDNLKTHIQRPPPTVPFRE